MQLIYYAHSYRKPDDEVNEFFQDLMVDEGLTPSLDPPSDRLNAAKPERHLRSTDAMVIVLPQRDAGASEYIRWEVGLGWRARKPQLVFVEDMLPDGLVPSSLLQRRFSRQRLLREARDHRHALRILKGYIGEDPPPTYQPISVQRRCVLIGCARLERGCFEVLVQYLERRRYKTLVLEGGAGIPEKAASEELVQSATLCIAVIEELTPADYYLLGAARASLTPTITLTANGGYAFDPIVPREYQPRPVAPNDPESLLKVIDIEVSTFEEDYLDLKEELQIRRYKNFRTSILQSQRREGVYSHGYREQIVNYIENAEFDMSRDKINVENVTGPVNIKSRLERVSQTVQGGTDWTEERRAELTQLLAQMQAALERVTESRPEDAERVIKTAELVIAEATKAKPDKTFLSITTEGLKQAAEAVADIAPTVLAVAAKVAAFIAGLSP